MDVYADGNLTVMRFGPLGSFANNAYIIADEASGEALVVDMPSGSQELIAAAKDFDVKGIVLTHTHHDHWMDYDLVKGALNAPVICHPAEQIMPADQIDQPLADGAELTAGAIRVRALLTPGHTPGSTCLLAGKFLFSGDTLFPGGPGHTNSPADLQQSIQSITSVLFALPDETEVLPGHGDGTTIGAAKSEYAVLAGEEHPADLCGDVNWAES